MLFNIAIMRTDVYMPITDRMSVFMCMHTHTSNNKE